MMNEKKIQRSDYNSITEEIWIPILWRGARRAGWLGASGKNPETFDTLSAVAKSVRRCSAHFRRPRNLCGDVRHTFGDREIRAETFGTLSATAKSVPRRSAHFRRPRNLCGDVRHTFGDREIRAETFGTLSATAKSVLKHSAYFPRAAKFFQIVRDVFISERKYPQSFKIY
jgi:hypothetical protein